ncbi:MAG TPA: hypothetical protein VG710_12330 [Opitutus sp.]|nr:hypothetical protein [Opitutus sp.]
MSLINDALAKIEAERAEEAAAIAAGVSPAALAERRYASRRRKSLRPAILGSLGLLLVFAVPIAFLVRHNLESEQPATRPAPIAINPEPPSADPPQSIPAIDPPPPQPELAPSTPPVAAYELAGMTAVGNQTLLGITRVNDHHSSWVAVGKTVGEVTVVSYDATKDQAVIRVDGREFTIGLAAAHAAE